MQGYNVILLYDVNIEHLLLCKRKKEPYRGRMNLIGGKIEYGENGIDSAYREMLEEANVEKEAVDLFHVMDFKYYMSDCYVEVYAGKLKYDVEVSGDENELIWSDLDCDFFDMEAYAGEGNIGHMIEQVKINAELIFNNSSTK
ncbi:MAG: NUDIX domain-containing protein [Oscillospiraceae bacterium]|nr:NUDIX domain-containing protein [Oscillospiraceae bacterium]